MAFMTTPTSAGGGERLPILKFDARAGRLFIIDRIQAADGNWNSQPTDITMARVHGLSPFIGTSLDPVLRSMGITTVVATGVSVNVGVFGLVVNAVDLGYQVVLVRDAVAGVPADYANSVIEQSLSLLATVVTTDDLLAAWA